MVKRRRLRELGELIESETYILGVLATVVENSKNLDLLGLLDRAQRDIKVRMRGDRNAYHFGGCIKVLVVSEEGRGRKMVMMMRVRRKKEKQNIERPTPDIYAPGGHRSLVTTKSYNNVCNGERAAASRLVSVGSTDNPPQPRFHVSLRVVSVCVHLCRVHSPHAPAVPSDRNERNGYRGRVSCSANLHQCREPRSCRYLGGRGQCTSLALILRLERISSS
jgi:hypothetical protein